MAALGKQHEENVPVPSTSDAAMRLIAYEKCRIGGSLAVKAKFPETIVRSPYEAETGLLRKINAFIGRDL